MNHDRAKGRPTSGHGTNTSANTSPLIYTERSARGYEGLRTREERMGDAGPRSRDGARADGSKGKGSGHGSLGMELALLRKLRTSS